MTNEQYEQLDELRSKFGRRFALRRELAPRSDAEDLIGHQALHSLIESDLLEKSTIGEKVFIKMTAVGFDKFWNEAQNRIQGNQ